MGRMNSSIVAAANRSSELALRRSATLSMAYISMAAADSIGLVMQNAAAAQQASQQVAQASVATTCALIIAKGS